MTSRPDRLVVVAGTGTEVGKTWCAARIIEHLRAAGVTVGARKPAQSFDPDDPHPTDAAVLAGATGEDPAVVCAPERSYEVALAPPMAADVLGRPVPTVAELAAACLDWPAPEPTLGVAELAGGVRSVAGRTTTYAMFTDPPLGRVGLTETQAREHAAASGRLRRRLAV